MIKLNEVGLPRLIDLVPPLDRLNTSQQSNKKLETLLAILQSQSDAIAANIGLLYQSWFVETCDDWTVSYIAKLIGLPSDLSDASHIARQRALVANTLIYRSYRGTAAALSCAIQDASGWPVMAVEGIDRQFTSAQAHILPGDQPRTLDIDAGDKPATPPMDPTPDHTSYTIYKTPITPPTNSDTVAVYYWRDQVVERSGIEAAPMGDDLFYFDPAARPIPLMAPHWGSSDPTGTLPMPIPIPTALTQLELSEMLENGDSSLAKVLKIFVNGTALSPLSIFAGDLQNGLNKEKTAALTSLAKNGTLVLVDPEMGALKLFSCEAEDLDCSVKIHSNHWASAAGDIGGGIYDRSSRMLSPDATTWSVLISGKATPQTKPPEGYDAVYPNLEKALKAWGKKKQAETVIHLVDNNRHALPETHLILGEDISTLAIQAAQGFQPTLTGNIVLRGTAQNEIWISGCYLTGVLSVTGGLNAVFVDCTLWPPQSNMLNFQHAPESLSAENHSRIDFDHCLTGSLILAGQDCVLSLSDCIVDGRGGASLSGPTEVGRDDEGAIGQPIGAAVAATDTTFLGDVYTLQLLGTVNTLIVGELYTSSHKTEDPKDGIWVSKSHQPQVEIVSHISGMPGYAVLGPHNLLELLEGGTDASEFGAWHDNFNAARLKAAQKMINHYCPIGMTVELIDTGLTPSKR